VPPQRADLPSAHIPTARVIGCGALVRELRAVLPQPAEVTYLPAPLHNRPDQIVPAIREALGAGAVADHVFIAYGDCGTGGALDAAISEWRQEGRSVERLPGNHCYEFFTGSAAFAELHESEPGTFFLTDYLARHFDLLVWQGLGLAEHPELLSMYFGNYTRLVFLSQTDEPDTLATLEALARSGAAQLGLRFEHRPTGLATFGRAVDVALLPGPSTTTTTSIGAR